MFGLVASEEHTAFLFFFFFLSATGDCLRLYFQYRFRMLLCRRYWCFCVSFCLLLLIFNRDDGHCWWPMLGCLDPSLQPFLSGPGSIFLSTRLRCLWTSLLPRPSVLCREYGPGSPCSHLLPSVSLCHKHIPGHDNPYRSIIANITPSSAPTPTHSTPPVPQTA